MNEKEIVDQFISNYKDSFERRCKWRFKVEYSNEENFKPITREEITGGKMYWIIIGDEIIY